MPAIRAVFDFDLNNVAGIWIQPNWLDDGNLIGMSQSDIDAIIQQYPYSPRFISAKNQGGNPISLEAADQIQSTLQSLLDNSSITDRQLIVTVNPDIWDITYS